MEAVEQWLDATGEWAQVTQGVSQAGPGRSLVWILLGLLMFLLIVEGFLSRIFSPSEATGHQPESGVLA